MTAKKTLLATTSLAAAILLAPAANAAKTPAAVPSNQEMMDRLERVERELQSEKEKNASLRTRVSTVEQAAADPVWSFSNGRPTITSGDGRFSLALRTRFQADVANFFQQDDLPPTVVARDLGSGAVIRRAYLGVEGRVFQDWWYEFRLNFGGTNAEGAELNLARIAYLGIPNFRINLGVIQPIFTLDNTTSSGNLMFIERAEVINIATDNFGGEDARRGVELTFQKQNFLLPGDNFILSGAFTGAKTGDATGHGTSSGGAGDEQSQVLGRLAYRLWSDGFSNVQIGGSAARIMHFNPTTGTMNLQDRPQMRVDGTRLVSTGGLSAKSGSGMWGADAAMNFRNLYLGGEYYRYSIERPSGGDPDFSGWYAAGSWVITGEMKPYSASAMNNEFGSWGSPRVSRPFSLKGGSWGAWEFAARYSELDLNWNEGVAGAATPAGGVRGGTEKIVTVGLNWYPNNNIRVMLNDMIVKVDRLNGAGDQIGQDLNILGARFQFQM